VQGSGKQGSRGSGAKAVEYLSRRRGTARRDHGDLGYGTGGGGEQFQVV